ncbi:MAG: hypothetical protein OHK0053_05090 [Microscillaceae bacterium]
MTNKEKIARKFLELYSAHQPNEMHLLFSSGATFEYVPYGEQGKGPVAEGAYPMWKLFLEAFSDFNIEILSVAETSDGRVIAETINGGTQSKEIFGIANKGKSQYTPHIFLFSFNENEEITFLKAYWDNNTIYAQLGHTENH